MPHVTDIPVDHSVMNQHWNALNGSLLWLNFSTPRNTENGDGKTAQDRVYGASGWETLARASDPFNWRWIWRPPRRIYPELVAVAPTGLDNPTIELANLPAHVQIPPQAAIDWVDPAAPSPPARSTADADYSAGIESLSGDTVVYPQALVVSAWARGDERIARAELSASYAGPGGEAGALLLHDDGVAPDMAADDGLYSGILPYTQNGTYTLSAAFTNPSGQAVYTQLAAAHSIGPNGETYTETFPPVGEDFSAAAALEVTVSGVQADDHGDTPAAASLLPADETPVPGRIDRARDPDLFRLDPLQPGRLSLRLGNLALGMQPRLRIYASNGTTLLSQHNPAADREAYFFVLLTVLPGQPVFIEVTDQDGQAAGGLYALSIGPPYAAEVETAVHLPLVLRR